MKKKMFGALVLSAALAMGTCVPAFAAGATSYSGSLLPESVTDMHASGVTGDVEDGDYTATIMEGATGTTDVIMSTYASNLQLTVPITVKFYGESAGGALITPSYDTTAGTSAYAIENRSTTLPAYVTGIRVLEQDWKLDTLANVWDNANSKLAASVANQKMTVSLGNVAVPSQKFELASAVVADLNAAPKAIKTLAGADWQIPVNNGTDNGALKLFFNGYNSKADVFTAADPSTTGNYIQTEDAFQIVYTVSSQA